MSAWEALGESGRSMSAAYAGAGGFAVTIPAVARNEPAPRDTQAPLPSTDDTQAIADAILRAAGAIATGEA